MIEEYISWQNTTLFITLVLAVLFLRSGYVKQLVEVFAKLGAAQKSLLETQEKKIEELKKRIEELTSDLEDERKTRRRREADLSASKREVWKLKGRLGGND